MGCNDRSDDDGPSSEDLAYAEYEKLEKRLFKMPASKLTVGELNTVIHLRQRNYCWSTKRDDLRRVLAAVESRRVI